MAEVATIREDGAVRAWAEVITEVTRGVLDLTLLTASEVTEARDQVMIFLTEGGVCSVPRPLSWVSRPARPILPLPATPLCRPLLRDPMSTIWSCRLRRLDRTSKHFR